MIELDTSPYSCCEGCKHDRCEFCADLEYQPSMDKFYHFVLSRQRDGETFEETEFRLRREA
jgi:hypothetical protein